MKLFSKETSVQVEEELLKENRKVELAPPYSSSDSCQYISRKYNVPLMDIEALLKKQDYKCAICFKESKLVGDHCHRTGKFRGLICFGCNSRLGKLNDDVNLIKRYVTYLEDFNSKK